MGPACPIIEHFPFIQAEHEDHHGRKPSGPDPHFSAVTPQDKGRQAKAQDAQDPVEGHTVSKELHIDRPLQEIHRDPGEKIRNEKLFRVPHVRQIGEGEADIIGIDQINGRPVQIKKVKQDAQNRQSHVHIFSVCFHLVLRGKRLFPPFLASIADFLRFFYPFAATAATVPWAPAAAGAVPAGFRLRRRR